jgi:hypothetical protein
MPWVAVKTIRPEHGGVAEYRKRFRREQEEFVGIEHENLCCSFDWNKEEEGLLWLAMPWIEGDDLGSVVRRRRRLDPRRAAALIAQAADGLHALHEQAGKAHRDVHPGNLMVKADDHLVVIDFGLAKRFDHPSGSPPEEQRNRWASTEARLGRKVTRCSDIYSLGLVLAFAVTGLQPDAGRARFDDAPAVPRELREIIDEATAHHPEERQPTAEVLAEDLREFLGSEARAEPVIRTTPGPSPRRRRAFPVGSVLAATVATAAGVFVGTSSLASSNTKEPSHLRARSSGLTLTAPASWRTASVADADRKLGMHAAVGGADAIALVGSIDHSQLPTDAEGSDAVDVSLPAGHALRVDDVGALKAQRMYVFHTAGGYPTIVCRGSYGTPRQTVDAACGRLARTASLADPALPIPYPTKAVRKQAAGALQGYAEARRAATEAIEAATTHAAVKAAAQEIASKASGLAKEVTAPGLGALRRSLAGAAKAWQAAAEAAAKGAGFHPAGTEVKTAEEAIRRARGKLVALGYAEPKKSSGQAG